MTPSAEKKFNLAFNIFLVTGMLVALVITTAFKLRQPDVKTFMLLLAAFGALMGVVSALLKFFNVDWFLTAWHSTYGEAIAIIPFLGIIGYMVVSSLRSERQ